MEVISFFSSNKYIALPHKKKPKVFLAIDNKKISKLSFDLYNPFSLKAKILKFVLRFVFLNFNSIAKRIFPLVHAGKSIFISHLEQSLQKEIHSSVYISTDLDKVVIQLISKNVILGYAKYPLKNTAVKKIENEKNAIEILSKDKIVSPLLHYSIYKDKPIIITKNEIGISKILSAAEYKPILLIFRKKNKTRLINHNRIKSIRKELESYKLNDLVLLLDNLISISKQEYHEAYEHGDFAPWNLLYSNGKVIPFDFEFFVEKGIDYFDEIKYNFQIENLLNKKNGKDLINSISTKVNIIEFNIIFIIFLMKEIIENKKASTSYNQELSLINLLRKNEFKY